ncbi:hypothetical protein DOO79_24050 (plasmid) [Xanthomonas citri pv. punicae]|nr:hypothetical protein DOO79_24050 [Xanthomonas citri pv. punicae]
MLRRTGLTWSSGPCRPWWPWLAWKSPSAWPRAITHGVSLASSRTRPLTDPRAGLASRLAQEDAKRRQRIICGGVAVEGNKVLTVAHCVEGQEALRVRTAAGEWRAARVIGADIARDVALIEIEGDPLPPIPIARVMPRQGQDVMAIGSPGGYGFAVGVGIVAWHAAMPQCSTRRLHAGDGFRHRRQLRRCCGEHQGEAVSLVSYGYGIYTQTVPIDRAQAVA